MADRPSRIDTIKTQRLTLTPVGADDLNALVTLYSDPQVAYWTGPWSRETIETWVSDMAARWAADGVGKWLVRDRHNGSVVGRGGFTRFDLSGEAVLELGWVVRDALTGRGYAQEMGRAAITWASEFEPHLPVVAFTEVHNHASQAVMERLGMKPAGVIRQEGLIEGREGLHPDAPFAIYRL